MFRQDVGDMSVDDPRITIKGNPSAPDWSANVDAGRLDLTNELSVVLPAAPSAPVPVPYKDGVNPAEIDATTENKFEVFKDVGDPDRWWWE